MWIRLSIALMAAMALVAALAPPSHAEVTVKSQDGLLELTLPNGWSEKHGGENAEIQAAGKRARVAVRTYPKADFNDLKAAANFETRKLLEKRLPGVEPEISDVKVNGKPAIRIEAEGTDPSGLNKGYLITVLEGSTMYISVVASANSSAFAKEKQVLAGFADKLKLNAPPAPNSPAPQ
jgi:hypothetical protein